MQNEIGAIFSPHADVKRLMESDMSSSWAAFVHHWNQSAMHKFIICWIMPININVATDKIQTKQNAGQQCNISGLGDLDRNEKPIVVRIFVILLFVRNALI